MSMSAPRRFSPCLLAIVHQNTPFRLTLVRYHGLMEKPTHVTAYQTLLLQASSKGRDALLFGESLSRAREDVPPFLIGEGFPHVYLEHPLIGDPFIDVTVLYTGLEPHLHIESERACNMDALLDWYAATARDHPTISFGFELDTRSPYMDKAAVHFWPFQHKHLVEPFCSLIGEPAYATRYLRQAARMPAAWPLAFFGVFRGRPDYPLRVCSYPTRGEMAACAGAPKHIRQRFDELGFGAYDADMLDQIAQLLACAPEGFDFQLDVFPDETLGDMFAIDMQFGIHCTNDVAVSFEDGVGADVMSRLQQWGAADERWKDSVKTTFARSVPVEDSGKYAGDYAFMLMPCWLKARWINGVLQPAKMYLYAHAELVNEQGT